MSDTIGHDQRTQITRQVGQQVIWSISGGRVRALPDGVELPVSSGYRVRIRLAANDTYTVQRVLVRGGREWIKGERAGVYCDEVSDAAYYASCFRSHSATEWMVAT